MGRRELKLSIENMRMELYVLLTRKNPTDTKVVQCSERLDKLIAQYQTLTLNHPQAC